MAFRLGTVGGIGAGLLIVGIIVMMAIIYGLLGVAEFFADLAGALAVMTPSLFATPVLLAGSEVQKQTFLPKVIEGEWSPYTSALIEYAFDFDANAPEIVAGAVAGWCANPKFAQFSKNPEGWTQLIWRNGHFASGSTLIEAASVKHDYMDLLSTGSANFPQLYRPAP